MKRNRIGFEYPGRDPDPIETAEAAADETLPEELLTLRKKIAQLAISMASTAFGRMPQSERFRLIAEYTELNSIEHGYTSAVRSPE